MNHDCGIYKDDNEANGILGIQYYLEQNEYVSMNMALDVWTFTQTDAVVAMAWSGGPPFCCHSKFNLK